MAVDLTLMPMLHGKDIWICAHDRLVLGTDYDLWKRIKALPQKKIPAPVSIFAGEKYHDACETPYGEPIMHIAAGDLAKIDLPPDSGFRNKAAWAYLAQLPEDWPVLLYWH